MRRRVLVVRSDSCGDVLLAGPAVRAVAARARVVLLTGLRGREAAALLPGVDRVATLTLPWIDPEPAPWITGEGLQLLLSLKRLGCREAVILTSFHQSPLPLALLLREVGFTRIAAASDDYPGSLLDVRSRPSSSLHEV